MRFGVCSGDEAFRASLCRAIQIWRVGICAEMQCAEWSSLADLMEAQETIPCCVLFLDVDDRTIQIENVTGWMGNSKALFVCSDNCRIAIASYAFHPDGFLPKQVTPAVLERALSPCSPLWKESLKWLEVSIGRSKVSLPLCELIWAEASGRNCILHSAHGQVTARESLSELEKRLPSEIFLRCQKSFLVNLRHVCKMGNRSFSMSNGTKIPIGRNHWSSAQNTYTAFQTRWMNQNR